MRNLSAEFKEQQNIGNHRYLKFVDITLRNGTELHLDNSNLWSNGFSFDEAVSSDNNFDIGSAIINKFSVVINNIEEQFSDYVFAGATAVVYAGLELSTGVEKIRICTGVVYEEPKQKSSIITLSFLDNMSKFDKDYSGVKTVFPATRNQIVRDICSHCGVTLQTVNFDNDSYIIQSRPDDEALTCRQMLAWVVQIGCQWAKCDAYGRLCIDWYKDILVGEISVNSNGILTINEKDVSGNKNPISLLISSDRPIDISKMTNMSVDLEDVVITGVKVKEYKEDSSEDNPAKTYMYGKEGYVLSISDNKLITENTGNTITSIIGEKCVGMRFRPFSANCITDIAIEAGDPVAVIDRKGNTFLSYATNVKLQPGSFELISCGAESSERNSAKQYSLLTQAEVAARKNIQKEKTEREKALEELAIRLENSPGVFTTVETDTGGGKIYYLHNKPKLSDSDMVWKMTADAFAVSTDGGKTYNAGLMVNGTLIAKIMNTIGINFDWGVGGSLVIRDEDGNETVYMNADTGTVRMNVESLSISGRKIQEIIQEEASKVGGLNLSLTNEYQGISTDYEGNISDFPEVKTTAQVYYGQTDVTSSCIFSIAESEFVIGEWDNDSHTYTVTGLLSDTGWVDITATYLSVIKSTKRFIVSKIKDGKPGADGIPGRTYFIEASSNVLKRSKDNTISPNFIEFKAYYRDGNSAARIPYAGRFIIEETVDGNTWKTIYTSTANEDTVKHYLYSLLSTQTGQIVAAENGSIIGVPRDVTSVRCKLYASGGTTNLMDMQSVAVVVDVDALTFEEIFNLLTKNGEIKGIYQDGNQLYISFTYAKGGVLTLGGNGNGNGTLKILDASGAQVGYIDNTGVHFNQGEFSGTLKAATGTFKGKLEAATGSFSGNLNAGVGGVIGGWKIRGDYIQSTDGSLTLYSDGRVKFDGSVLRSNGHGMSIKYGLELYTNSGGDFSDGTDGFRIHGLGSLSGRTLVLNSDKYVGLSASSSRRYKDHIRNMSEEEALALMDVPVVWFRYKDGYLNKDDDLNGKEIPGFYAENIADSMRELAIFNSDGSVEDWNYRTVIPVMEKQIQILNKKMEDIMKKYNDNTKM